MLIRVIYKLINDFYNILSQNDLIALRPGDGISPMEIDTILGKELSIDLPEGTKILKEHLR